MKRVGNTENIIYRKLEQEDLDIFISMRIKQLQEEGATGMN
jgi:hypothetical protein